MLVMCRQVEYECTVELAVTSPDGLIGRKTENSRRRQDYPNQRYLNEIQRTAIASRVSARRGLLCYMFRVCAHKKQINLEMIRKRASRTDRRTDRQTDKPKTISFFHGG